MSVESTATDEDIVLVSSCSSARRRMHRPNPSGEGVACPTPLRKEGAKWIPKTKRQCVFYDACSKCFPDGESE